MWILYDFRVVKKSKSENVKYSSQINNSEYDCDEITRRILDFNWYSGNMGRGEVVFSSPNTYFCCSKRILTALCNFFGYFFI